jgi:hypothetical protein
MRSLHGIAAARFAIIALASSLSPTQAGPCQVAPGWLAKDLANEWSHGFGLSEYHW